MATTVKDAAPASPAQRKGSFVPLRHRDFRNIWSASVLSNFGLLINGVGAGWAMTELSGEPQKVALIQTALTLPFMLLSVPAGAIADTYDRRKFTMAMLACAVATAGSLAAISFLGLLTPALLILMCLLLGACNALFAPAWQASVSEQVPAEDLPPAVALNSISFNIARSFGPAIGGWIVAVGGTAAAFTTTTACYLPIMLAFYLWQRTPDKPRLPPERIWQAVISGVRFVAYSPTTRNVILRSVLTGIAGASISALLPIVARDMIGGGAMIYGVLLGAFGIGAVLGALLMSRLRHLPVELQIGGGTAILGLGVIALSFSHSLWLAVPVLFVCGFMWMQPLTQFNVAMQTQAPRWVTGRALASYQAAIAGGIAVGSIMWGRLAEDLGTATALSLSGAAILCVVVIGRLLPVAADDDVGDYDGMAAPEVNLGITGRSGPILVGIEYKVDADNARQFYEAMQPVGLFRQRNGAYQWSLARDIADAESWLERFSCPTWHDYLRQRDRMTAGDQAVFQVALELTQDGRMDRVRRFLERPTGSVRWRSDSTDPGMVVPFSSTSG